MAMMSHPIGCKISLSKNMLNIIIIKFFQIFHCIINKSINRPGGITTSWTTLNRMIFDQKIKKKKQFGTFFLLDLLSRTRCKMNFLWTTQPPTILKLWFYKDLNFGLPYETMEDRKSYNWTEGSLVIWNFFSLTIYIKES